MRTLIQTLLVSLAGLLASATSTAVPIDFIIENDSVPGFHHSIVRSCADAPCASGHELAALSGTLRGDLEDGMLLNLSGTVTASNGFLSVDFDVRGSFDFTDGGAGGELSFDRIGTFRFANSPISGPANGFDGTDLYARGVLAHRYAHTRDHPFRLGMDLGGRVVPAVPEPSAALLFGLGALVVGGRIRR